MSATLEPKELYWEQVFWAATTLFRLKGDAVSDLKASLSGYDVGVEEAIYHEHPLRVAADLDQDTKVTPECLASFNMYWANPWGLFDSQFESQSSDERDKKNLSRELEFVVEADLEYDLFLSNFQHHSVDIPSLEFADSHSLGVDGSSSQRQVIVSISGRHSYSQLKRFSLSILAFLMKSLEDGVSPLIIRIDGMAVSVNDEKAALKVVGHVASILEI